MVYQDTSLSASLHCKTRSETADIAEIDVEAALTSSMVYQSTNKRLCGNPPQIQENLAWFSEQEKDRQRKDSKGVYYSRIPSHECLSNLFQVSMERLEKTGWYWGRISKSEATSVLEEADVGTFLLRDSSDSRYYFSLSVRLQTTILNIRVLYSYGKFMFDCFETRLNEIPKFDCVVKLICYYVSVSQNKQDKRKVLARSEEGDAEIRLEKPLFKEVPTLKHLCRRVVNRTLTKEEQSQLLLPNTVEKFMRKYPYSI